MLIKYHSVPSPCLSEPFQKTGVVWLAVGPTCLRCLTSVVGCMTRRDIFLFPGRRGARPRAVVHNTDRSYNDVAQNRCLRLALGLTYYDRTRSIDLHDLTNVPMIKTRMTVLAVKTFRSLENTQCFTDLVLNHEIVQKRSGSNTILVKLLDAIQGYAFIKTDDG